MAGLNFPLLKLPLELIVRIVQKTSFIEYLRLQLTCKHLRRISDKNSEKHELTVPEFSTGCNYEIEDPVWRNKQDVAVRLQFETLSALPVFLKIKKMYLCSHTKNLYEILSKWTSIIQYVEKLFIDFDGSWDEYRPNCSGYLLQNINVRCLIMRWASSQYVVPKMLQLHRIELTYVPLTENEFLSLNNDEIVLYNCDVEFEAIRKFLKLLQIGRKNTKKLRTSPVKLRGEDIQLLDQIYTSTPAYNSNSYHWKIINDCSNSSIIIMFNHHLSEILLDVK